jgi:hypothetical protein
MKKLLLIATALTICISSFSQKKEIDSKIIIAGNLKNYDAKEISVFIGESLIPSSIEEGNFKITFDADEAALYQLYLNFTIEELILYGERGSFDFFLSPGDSIYLSADFTSGH